MPCMGPDLDAARKEGRKVGENLLRQLINDHHLFEIDDADYKGMVGLPEGQKRWKIAKEKFLTAVEDLFEEDAANSF